MSKAPQITPDTPDPANSSNLNRDPEDRAISEKEQSVREKMMDKTLADSYPCSDAPSSIPYPGEDDSIAEAVQQLDRSPALGQQG